MSSEGFKGYMSGNRQPEAIGHTRTCLQPESGASTMHSLQPCQLGNDPLLNMVQYSLWTVRGGPSPCKTLGIPGGFWGLKDTYKWLGSGHNRSNVGGITEIPRVLGGI